MPQVSFSSYHSTYRLQQNGKAHASIRCIKIFNRAWKNHTQRSNCRSSNLPIYIIPSSLLPQLGTRSRILMHVWSIGLRRIWNNTEGSDILLGLFSCSFCEIADGFAVGSMLNAWFIYIDKILAAGFSIIGIWFQTASSPLVSNITLAWLFDFYQLFFLEKLVNFLRYSYKWLPVEWEFACDLHYVLLSFFVFQ